MNRQIEVKQVIDLDILMAETLEIVLNDNNPYIYVDKTQVWYNAVIKSDAQDLSEGILYSTILPPMWKRIYKALLKSDALQIPVYIDPEFIKRKNELSVDRFINACVTMAHNNAAAWGRLVSGDASLHDYINYFSIVIN